MAQDYLQIIQDQQTELNKIQFNDLITRNLPARKLFTTGLALIITGIRRSGKSTLAHQLMKDKKYAYINFDDERLINCSAESLNILLENLYKVYGNFEYLVLDEIQNVEGWSLFVNRLLRNNIQIIVTGSNSRLLSKEYATHLTGRYDLIELFPFSFDEYLRFNKLISDWSTTKAKGLLSNSLSEYTNKGGFPEISKGADRDAYITNLFTAIVTRDIIFRYNLKYAKVFRDIAIWLVNNFASELSYNRIKNLFNIGSENTIKNYVTYLEEAYLIMTIPKFSYKKQEQLRYKKAYVSDMAFASVIADKFSENTGRIMENLVYLSLKSKYANTGTEIFYYKKQYEVDFVLYLNGIVIELIQVCYDLKDAKTLKREVRALQLAGIDLNPRKMTIITSNEESIIDIDGIQIQICALPGWLLEKPGKAI